MDDSLEFWFRLYTPDSGSMGRIICAVEKDNTYHVESRFHGRFFSAHFTEGVRSTVTVEHQDQPDGYWEIIKVPQLVTASVEQFAESITGTEYDEFGAFNSAMGIPLRNPYRWFCSLTAEEIGKMSGIIGLDALPSPSTLRRQLKTTLNITTALAPVQGLKLTDEDIAYLNSLTCRAKHPLDVSVIEQVIQAAG